MHLLKNTRLKQGILTSQELLQDRRQYPFLDVGMNKCMAILAFLIQAGIETIDIS